MNLLAKLLIVLIFIGSIGLASFSVVLYATHTNWREEVLGSSRKEGLKQQLDKMTQERDTLRKQQADMKLELELEIQRQDKRIVALTERVRQLENECDVIKEEKNELDRDLAVQVAAVNALSETAERLRMRLDEASTKLLDSQTEWAEMSTTLIKEMDKSHGLAIQVANYQATANKLAEDYRNAIEVLRMRGLSPDPALYPKHPPSGIQGSVTEVRPRGMVEISIGSDSGLVKGHQLDVIRHLEGRSAYIGKIEIVDTTADRAVARVMPEYRKGTVKSGDEVTYIEMNDFAVN